MKKTRSIHHQAASQSISSTWRVRWKKIEALVTALILPGLPQILKKPRLPQCLLFMFGTGALITLLIGLNLSGEGRRAIDVIYSILFSFDSSNIYPLLLHESVAASGTVLPIHPPGEPMIVQPFFWKLVGAHIATYVFCAILSVWQQWKFLQKDVEAI